jgi:hypothetical protein
MHDHLDIAGTSDMEYLGLRVVDPDDRVEVGRHFRILLCDRLAVLNGCAHAAFLSPAAYSKKNYRNAGSVD